MPPESTPPTAEHHPPGVTAALAPVAVLLADGRPVEALAAVPKGPPPWADNARAVCLLRSGRPRQALEVLRGLVLGAGGAAVRADAPTVIQANYATALLLSGNADAFHGILAAVPDRGHPAVARLRAAVRASRAKLTVWQRVGCWFDLRPAPSVALDFPPGDL